MANIPKQVHVHMFFPHCGLFIQMHYKNLPLQFIEIFSAVKNENFAGKKYIFNILAQNIDCGYMLEPPRRGCSNKYTQSVFWSKNKKNNIPLHTPGLLYESGV